ncbi:MAG: hypothetical protein NTX24_00580 [Candidatus Pacearchaeota archaeon]|nr:hypothetical protein [Candidatus Pacearchaeota archaeon]
MVEKKQENPEKKKSKWWLIILIVAIILLSLIIVFSVRGCHPKPDVINDTGGPGPEPQEQPTPPKVYKTSPYLSEIIFTRDGSGQNGEITQHASFKVTGYMQEIDPENSSLTFYSDKAYNFKDGMLEWNLEETYEYGSLDETITSSGKEKISDLNVYWDNGQPTALTNGDYDLKLGYSNPGFNEQNKPELRIFGKLLIPITETENGVTKKQTSTIQFPIRFIGYNFNPANFSDSFIAKEGYQNEWQGTIISGYQDAIFAEMAMVTTTDIPILAILGPWHVSWDLKFL